MRVVAIFSGAGGTIGDDIVFHVIKRLLEQLGTLDIWLNPKPDVMSDVKGIILGGCGIIYDENSVLGGRGNPTRYWNQISCSKTLGIPILGYGLGWQGLPLSDGKNMWVNTLNSINKITVWHGPTKSYLKSIGVTSEIIETEALGFMLSGNGTPLICDVAFLTHPPKLIAQDCRMPEWEKNIYGNLKIVATALGSIRSVAIIPFCRFFIEPLQEIARLSNGYILDDEVLNDPSQVMSSIHGAKVCVTTTLHALIAAATAKRRILALYPPEPLKPKIRWMAEELGVRRLPINSPPNVILEEIENTYKDSPPDISKQLERNKENVRILREWVESGK